MKRELAELRTTIETPKDDDKCVSIQELEEHKAATAMIIESLRDSVNTRLEEQYKELKEQTIQDQSRMQHVGQKQTSNGKY